MRIFVTGATGFIGSRIVPELLEAGHSVLGMTRSDAGAKALIDAGAEPYHARLEDPAAVAAGASQAEAVIHTAFDHDFSNFVANCEKDRQVILAMGETLKGSDRPILLTSGTGFGAAEHGKLATEDVANFDHPNPRAASELAGVQLLDQGVKVLVMRLPQVHDTHRQGLVSPYIINAKQKGAAAYVGEGLNRWPAAHVLDVARLYKLAIEQGAVGERFHAVDEEGVPACDIAAAVGSGLRVPAMSVTSEQAGEHFGWLAMFMGLDMPASSAWTRERLGWKPSGPGMIVDLRDMSYGEIA
jgi:nucleoside-diphosphate-sugar epimerase